MVSITIVWARTAILSFTNTQEIIQDMQLTFNISVGSVCIFFLYL